MEAGYFMLQLFKRIYCLCEYTLSGLGEVLLHYKTGAANAKGWKAEMVVCGSSSYNVLFELI